MINSYNTATQELDVNEDIVFSTNRISTDYTISHISGATTFVITKPGYYLVEFNGDGATQATAGLVTTALFKNGVEVEGAEASEYSSAATEVVNLGFSSVIKVLPACCCVDNNVILTIRNTGVASTFTNANLIITKLH